MNSRIVKRILRAVQTGDLSSGEAAAAIQQLQYSEMGFAKVDVQREARCGLPEAIFCQGKTVEQVAGIARRMIAHGVNVLGTRATKDMAAAVAELAADTKWTPLARTIVVKRSKATPPPGEILIVCAGTADMPVAEEARITAEFLDNKVHTIYDIGVAGLHRLLHHSARLRKANVIIVVAGMEGALASVVGGMVARPVIAVPTSVGYGASFNGLAPLLTMLNSCAAGVAVVNIDNGFGAACMASLINHTSCNGSRKNGKKTKTS